VTVIIGLPILKSKKKHKSKKVWRVLLDSGSDGDILFAHETETFEVPFKERYKSQTWRTSNGIFKTTKVADLEISFPEFSKSKRALLTPDVFDVPSNQPKPVYDLIIGIDTMIRLGIILDFKDLRVTMDSVTIPMRPHDSFPSTPELQLQLKSILEPASTREMTNRAVKILDSKYEKANLPELVNEYSHLTVYQRHKLLDLLQEFEELFDGTLGDWDTEPVSLKLKPDAKPFHGRAFPVPHIHLKTLKKEMERLCEIGVLKRQPVSEWASPTFIIPKKEGTVRFISDFREVNKLIVRSPYPIPKISSVLQEMEGFTYATALDLNMGYYTIRLDGDAQKICTIIVPWGKYSYLRLPMGISRAPDIFQEKMSGLMEQLEYIRVYIDDLLIITRASYDDHLSKLREVLRRLQKAGLRVNAPKSTFATHEVEYLGYVLTRHGIKPQSEKVQAILAIEPPQSVKQLRRFLGMVQYYRDLWDKRSHLIAPLTDLVGECGQTKETRRKGTKKKPFYWDTIHQEAFDAIKKALAREVLLAYPDYSSPFEIYTDASSRQLGAVITQRNRPIAFFSRKLSSAQRKYSVTELELLSIVECLKEFKGMLWGQRIKVYTDHKNLMRDALGLTSDRVYRWRLLLEEYGPDIVYIKGVDNTVADAISRLDYNPEINPKDLNLSIRECYCHMATLLSHYGEDTSDDSDLLYIGSHDHSNSPIAKLTNDLSDMSINDIFAQNGNEADEIYPVTVSEIVDAQKADRIYKRYLKATDSKTKTEMSKASISVKVIDDLDVLVYRDSRLLIPKPLQQKIVTWFHHYLQHPGHTRLELTIASSMYWKSLRSDVRRHVKRCRPCQFGKKRKRLYGKLPSKIAETIPWRSVCVDLIGPYTLKDKKGTILDFMCLTMIDPATGWFELIELPLASVEIIRKGEEIEEIIIDKSSAQVSRLFNQQWLSRYPRAKYIIYDNGSEFKLNFEALCESYGIERKPTTVRNPQANAILERLHGVLTDMMRTSEMDMADDVTSEDIDTFLVNAAWAVRSTYHTVLRSTPGAAIFGRDMLFDIPYLADWNAIGKRRQDLVDQNNARENARRIDFDYAVGQQVLVRKDGILRKAESRYLGPYVITQVHTNGTVRIQRGTISERINIRRLTPFFE
jgi:hypothetical protein